MTRFALGILAACLLAAAPSGVHAQQANYDESKVPKYELPDPLTTEAGEPVDTAEKWRAVRRSEILRLFEEHVYGKAPEPLSSGSFTVASVDLQALDGKAIRKEVVYRPSADSDLELRMLIYIPHSDEPVPAFLGLNFYGNHTIHTDPGITLNPGWMRPNREKGIVNNRATEASRGTSSSRWPVDLVLENGCALATMYCGDIDPDTDDGFKNGVHGIFDKEFGDKRPDDAWGTISAWAWGLSRMLDYLQEDPHVDGTKVAVVGHSRLGKTALWAGATDERFAMVVSNNSGCGGAALARREFGETVAQINSAFPHWFNDRFTTYNDNESACPVDQHELVALIAPRPVYIASATGDRWADPKGEYLSAYHADPVYRLLGTDGLGGDAPAPEQPTPDEPRASGTIGYHLRTGKHDITRWDWEQYLKFAKRHWNEN